MKKIILVIACFAVMTALAYGAEDPMTKLANETLDFFKPASGKIVSVKGKSITAEMSSRQGLKIGMRLNILREGEPFRHPVTREVLGKVESQAGKAEIKSIQGDVVTGVMLDGTAQAGDRLRLSEVKVRVVFIQDRTVDWYLGDDLYRKLKATGRVEMIDTALETDDAAKAIDEAKRLNAEIVLLLTAKEADKGTLLREKAFWVSDGSGFLDSEVKVDVAYSKELKFGGEFFGGMTGEALFKYDLPFGARFVVTGDFDGDGKQELALSTGKDVLTYQPSADLKPLWELKGHALDDHLWIDTLDFNGNGRDELIITSMKNTEVVSYIYELSGTEFKKLWEGKIFLRRSGTGLIGQKYSQDEGYVGEVFSVIFDGSYKQGEKVKLPKGVNIYDYIVLEGTAGQQRHILAYDEGGFLNVFDEKGIRIWKSSTSLGPFYSTFKKKSPASYVQETEWSVKDRLSVRNREIMIAQKVPLLGMAKGLGNKKSRIDTYWWTGFTMEANVLINDIPGTILDFALVGDKMVVLSSPFLGLKFDNILKGESVRGMMLNIYSARGK